MAELTEQQLGEIEARANGACRCDDHDCVSEFVQIVDKDVPALVAEVRQLRAQVSLATVMLNAKATLKQTAIRWTFLVANGLINWSIWSRLLPLPWSVPASWASAAATGYAGAYCYYWLKDWREPADD